MAKLRVTSTDQLSNIIDVVELGQRTGLLSVERDQNGYLEEGDIYFVSGRATYAVFGDLQGREALAALARWRMCRFAFEPDALRPAPNLLPVQSMMSPGAPQTTPHPAAWPNMAGSQSGIPQSRPFEGSGSWPQQSSGDFGNISHPGVVPSGYSGPLSSSFPGAGYPNASYPGSGSFPSFAASPTPPEGLNGGSPSPNVQPALNRRPRRAPDVRDLMVVVTTHNLSRSHRTILLLADGEHTVLDLGRLSSKPVDEVVGLLDELEQRGLVYYYK